MPCFAGPAHRTNSYEWMTIRSIKRGHCCLIVHYCNAGTWTHVADRSFLGRVANPKIFDEGSWDLDQQEGEGGPLRIVTSLNFTSLTPTNRPTNPPSASPRWLARGILNRRFLSDTSKGLEYFSCGDDDADEAPSASVAYTGGQDGGYILKFSL